MTTSQTLTKTPDIPPAAFSFAPTASDYRRILDALPAAVYMTDANGTLTYFNRAAAAFAGREPEVGHDKWCVAWKLYRPDGTPLPLDQCPMAVALREQRAVRGVDIIAERPNGERVATLPFPTPIFDQAGRFEGAINVLVDIERLKDVEKQVQQHAAQQTALFRFTDRLYRAEAIEEIYEASLDAILQALGCDRASVLLFDDSGVMRFVASRGLSDDYRRAVDGHSPWTRDNADPEPIFIEDVELSDLPETLKAVVRKEGIAALGFIPLVVDRVLIGKFMTYHERPHTFAPDEQDLAITIARQLGFAIQRKRTQTVLDNSIERLRLATQAGKVGLWDWNLADDRIGWTDSLYAMHGVAKNTPAMNFADWINHVHPEDRPKVRSAIDGALSRSEPYELEIRSLRPDGGETWIYTNATVVRDRDSKPLRMVGATVDITSRKQAEIQRDLLVAELSHRVKNTLATVVSIFRQSFSKRKSVDNAKRSFEGRIQALAGTHTRLAEANWMNVPIRALIEDETAPYLNDDGSNVRLSGPDLPLSSKRAVTLGMAFHELTTNAAKYGALSVPAGVVDVTWSPTPDGGLVLQWRESGGPAVRSPSRSGFGRLLLERAVKIDLKGEVELQFSREGLSWHIALPGEARPPH